MAFSYAAMENCIIGPPNAIPNAISIFGISYYRRVNQGILARTLARKMALKDSETNEVTAAENLEDVPEWVQEAYEAGWLAMTSEDDYTGIWVAVPGEEFQGVQLAIRASGTDILVNHGDFVGVLKECKWEVWS